MTRISDNPIPVLNGPIAVIDILGFRNFVSSNELSNVIDAYAHTITGSSFTAEVLGEDLEFMVYSDTIAIRLANLTETGFSNFIKSLQLILHNYFYTNQLPGYLSLPIRGAIAAGEYSWHKGDISTQVIGRKKITATAVNFVAGMPIIRAHDHEKAQKWIGISFDPGSIKAIEKSFPISFKQLISTRYLVEYPLPIAKDHPRGLAVNPTCRATFEGEFVAFTERCSGILEESDCCSGVVEKYRNTLKFLRYLYDTDSLIPIMPYGIPEQRMAMDDSGYTAVLAKMNGRCLD